MAALSFRPMVTEWGTHGGKSFRDLTEVWFKLHLKIFVHLGLKKKLHIHPEGQYAKVNTLETMQ